MDYSSALEKGIRSEQAPVATLAEMYVQGLSTRKVKSITEELCGIEVSVLQLTQGQPLRWQNPLASMLDALQPAVVEEVIYRFALWGLLWLILRGPFQKQAAWLAGLLAMLIHNYAHFDDLFIQAPWLALGMGAVMALIWGLPPLILARRRGLEAAIAFHWVQDVARFWAGF